MAMNSPPGSSQHRRQGLNPLMTGVNQAPQFFTSPAGLSATTPSGYHSVPYTPASAVRQYNPQQWGGASSGESSARFSAHSPGDTDVPAPPPYSPPRNQRQNNAASEESYPAMSSLNRSLQPTNHRSISESSSSQAFPPPPGNHSRGLSRDRAQPLFGLGGIFTRKPATPEALIGGRPSPDLNRDHAGPSRRPLQVSVEPFRYETEVVLEQRPPNSRRALSAGAAGTPSSSRSRASSTTRWEPGMPLPPPPPGPPPQPSSRSQSLSRADNPVVSPPTRRPQAISTLGPVPPTPAGWTDGDALPRPLARGRSPTPGLSIDTSSVSSSTAPESGSGSSSSGLARARAVRGEPKSIRERRSESRSGKNPATTADNSNNPWVEAITPSDIVVPPMTVLGRRPTIARSTPRSARSVQEGQTPGQTPGSSRTFGQNTPTLAVPVIESRGSTPRPSSATQRREAPTPPFSPDQSHLSNHIESPMVPPKSLPTPPPQSRRTGSSPRPISHILHTPLRDSGIQAPLSPARPESRQSASQPTSEESFCRDAIQRHNSFAQKEAAASSDEERVRLFAEFIVAESRLRRERYAFAIDGMGSEILELTRDLFRPPLSNRSVSNQYSSERNPKSAEFRSSGGIKLASIQTGSISDSTPSSASSISSQNQGRPESMWINGYMPSLSPIASISASNAFDESSSRGRPSSRWWEVGQSGSGGSPTTKFERSKRESKYMGMPRELRESLQWQDNGQPSTSREPSGQDQSSSSKPPYGQNEYPREKVGWHEDQEAPPSVGLTPAMGLIIQSAPVTPSPHHLDVSRLVTLPPPYPRHHPAVNNNHPDLSEIRTSVRGLSDFSKVEASKETFKNASTKASDEATAAATQRRQSMRAKIQQQIEAGSMTYADAAVLEAESTTAETETTKALCKTDFDLFQNTVVTPINDLLMDRVHRATILFEQLRSKLFVDAQQQDPNATQEEGDEQPELLEKLTLLKWIFDAREQLHRELYDLLSDRNDRYKNMVTLPYRLAKNTAKLANAEAFFAADARTRRQEHDERALQRYIEFMDVIETNVVRGVEVQLSAFWDIAPGLRQVIEKVPARLSRDFRVQIPEQEYAENPSYYEFPMQYLWSVLQHGRKSTYQFIESQINLLCLLHEVKTAVAGGRCRVVETERVVAGEQEEDVKNEMIEALGGEERRLTEDLKEKVRCVEELWGSALGELVDGVQARVKEFLEYEGGWEGMDDE